MVRVPVGAEVLYHNDPPLPRTRVYRASDHFKVLNEDRETETHISYTDVSSTGYEREIQREEGRVSPQCKATFHFHHGDSDLCLPAGNIVCFSPTVL